MDGKKTAGGGVERVTVTLPREVVEALDAEVAAGGGRNRSALASELLRCAQQHRAGRTGEAMAAGSVSAAYDAGARGVMEGLARAEGEAPAAGVEVVATVETGLGGGKRLRVALAKGKAGAVWGWARRLERVRGVRRVQVSLTEVEGGTKTDRRTNGKRKDGR